MISISLLIFSCGKKNAAPLPEVPMEDLIVAKENEEPSFDQMRDDALFCWVNEINPKLEDFKFSYIKHSQIDEYHLEIKPMTIKDNSYLIGYYKTVLIDISKSPVVNMSMERAYVMGLEDVFENGNEKIYKFVSINYLMSKSDDKGLFVPQGHAEKSEFQFTIEHNHTNGHTNVIVEKGYYGIVTK
jgi:hypothetical protein